ncbi:hypothetical protein [Bacillus sp. 2205SS5-2]
MTPFQTLPKTIKKTVQYIQQDAELKQLLLIENMIHESIAKRKETLKINA